MSRAKDPRRPNKFQYKNLEGITPPPGSPSTGWAFSDAIIQRDCPRCGCSAGFDCQTPGGRKLLTPHCERVVITDDHKRSVGGRTPSPDCELCGGSGECETELYEGLVDCWRCYPED